MAAPIHSVFLSHSGRDKAFVTELYRRLTRDGVSCFFDIESIGWGENWVRALERAIDECGHIVLVLSPDFCNSEWAEVERTSAIADGPAGLRRKVLPLILLPCSDLPGFPRFLRHVQAIDVSTAALFEQNYPRICRHLDGVLREDVTLVDRHALPPLYPLPERHRMPYHSLGDGFVGRIDAIWKLYDSLFRDSTTVLQGAATVVGTGGLGKTQLAIEYAHRFGSFYSGGVYWVDADRGLSALIAQISGPAGVEVDPKAAETEQVGQIWRGLNRLHAPSLVILDNFPENVALRPYLPTTGRVHTIVTTRRQDLGQAAVRLNTLTSEEGIRLLSSGERRFGETAAAMVLHLGGLPLALELAKSYLNYRSDLSIEALLGEINAGGEIDALAEFALDYRDQLPSGHELDVVRTFQMSWDIAPDSARQVLRVIGELAPAPVPLSLVRSILHLPEQQPPLRNEPHKSVSELARLSLIERDVSGHLSAHRLILAFVRHRNRVDDASPLAACLQTIEQQMQRSSDNPDAGTTRQLELLVPHAAFLLATNKLSPQQSGKFAAYLGIHHRTMGRFAVARNTLESALASAEKSYEPGHPSIARRQSNLALVLQDLGELGEARDLLRRAYAASLQRYGADHPSTKTFRRYIETFAGTGML